MGTRREGRDHEEDEKRGDGENERGECVWAGRGSGIGWGHGEDRVSNNCNDLVCPRTNRLLRRQKS